MVGGSAIVVAAVAVRQGDSGSRAAVATGQRQERGGGNGADTAVDATAAIAVAIFFLARDRVGGPHFQAPQGLDPIRGL